MPTIEPFDPDSDQPTGLTRRQLLQRMGLVGVGAALVPNLVLNAASAATKTTKKPAAGGNAGAQLAKMLNIDPKFAGKGTDFSVGAVLAISGPGSFYGKTMSRGIDLAVAHIKAAGGPNFKVIYKDHKSGDPAAGQAAVTELGAAGVSAKLASYVDDLGAMFQGTAQYKMFTLDGGGGTSIFGQGKP